jgi:16S rRNA (cytosine967-C5)-methyltransferase
MHEEKQSLIVAEIITSYKEDYSLSIHLKRIFQKYSFLGSNDRKHVAAAAYSFFKFGKAIRELSLGESIAAGCYLFSNNLTDLERFFIEKYTPLRAKVRPSLADDRIGEFKKYYPSFDIHSLFPFQKKLSPSIDKEKFILSCFTQPLVWLRAKKKYFTAVTAELKNQKINYVLFPHAPQAIGIYHRFDFNSLNCYKKRFFEVQDLSSQQTGEFFKPEKEEQWWDCCSGSGGKSLLLNDMEETVKIYVTDRREKIIANLRERFSKAGLKRYTAEVKDVSEKITSAENVIASTDSSFIGAEQSPDAKKELFDGIIADVPCTGSGTWNRNPEMLWKFDEKQTDDYVKKQLQIVSNVIPFLKKKKPLVYITCSVFEGENENVVKKISERFNLKIESQQILHGYLHGADTMFVARLC